jgi:hypothetical protein
MQSMLTTRERTMLAKITATGVALGVPVALWLPPGLVVIRHP